MLRNIEIENFKVIDKLRVEGFTNINFFVGDNGVGKTSLLEAIFTNLNYNDASKIVPLANARSLYLNVNNYNIDTFFNKLNIKNPIKIKSEYYDETIEVTITPKYNKQSEQYEMPQKTNSIINSNNNEHIDIIGLGLKAKSNDIDIESSFTIQKGNIDITNNKIPSKYKTGAFIPSSLAFITPSILINIIRINKEEDQLNTYLKIFDKNVRSVETVNNEVMVDIENFSKRINVELIGEGFKKYLHIVASLISRQDIICIDEIENGLSRPSIKKLIEAILKLNEQNNVQLFITTHSYEFLEILNEILVLNNKDYVNVFNIARTKNDELQFYKYTSESLKNLIETKTEFRY